MGIPKYFKWITNKHPELIIDISNSSSTDNDDDELIKCNSIDNLFLDANCLIHPCVRKVLSEYKNLINEHFDDYKQNKNNIQNNLNIYSKLEKQMFKEIEKYIIYLLNFSKPNKLLYIAIDGVAPRAKMEQQRTRRYRSMKEREIIKNINEKHNIKGVKEWDTNAITPGTLFMSKISNFFKKNFKKSLKKYNINIIFSDTSRPGEGEHKIVEYLRKHDDNDINCIYGLDADLIMLSLCVTNTIFLLRESVHFGKINLDHLLYFSINKFKQILFTEISDLIIKDDFEIKTNIVIDYVFLCFLLGNDFLPHLVNLDIANDSINDLLIIYSKLVSIRKTYLINEKNEINYSFLHQILNQLFNNEDKILVKIQKKIDNRRIYNNKYSNQAEKEINLIKYYPVINKNNFLKLGSKKWRDKYYNYYFNINDTNKSKPYIDNVCKIYIEGLQWNIKYYLEGCPSWKWYYPFRASPCLREICQYLKNRIYNINFINDLPYKPIQQLTLVLPIQSSDLLPTNYKKIINSNLPGILEYYPINFQLDRLNHIWFHECNPVIPIINDEKILNILDKIEIDAIDNLKNTVTKSDYFIIDLNKKKKNITLSVI